MERRWQISHFLTYSVILAFQPSEKSYREDVPACVHYIDIQAAIEFNMSLLNIPSRESLLSL